MDFWWILYIIDWLLFVPIGLTVAYVLLFSVASIFKSSKEIKKSKQQYRFIVLIPSYNSDAKIIETVNSILGQTYTQRNFDIVVISNHQNEIINMRLAQLPITLLTPNFERQSRIKSLQLAINNLPQFKIYDAVVILEAGDVVETEFLEQVNDAYEAAGTKAIQTHKLSLNRDSTPARLSAIFEEINNSIFRRGHISVGLSAALASSGMAFEFNWFKDYIQTAKANWSDKELEALLTRQHIYVDYFDKIEVYNEKARQAEDFNRQHFSWIWIQFRTIIRNIHYLPSAIAKRHYDLIDKLLQWLLIPRIIMMAVIIMMGVLVPFIYMSAALKWWALFAFVLLFFAIATPNYLVDEKWDSTFFKMPFVFLSPILNKFKLGRKINEMIGLKS